MKKILTMLMSVVALLSAATAQADTYRINVKQFDRITVDDNVNVVFRCNPDSTGYVVYEGSEEFADAFIFTNKKGDLRIQVTTEDVGNPDLPVIYLYSDYLTGVTNSSDFSVRVDSNASVPKFTAKLVGNGEIICEGLRATEVNVNFITGKGKVILEGRTTKAVYKMVGTGLIQADMLSAELVECVGVGSGTIGCMAEKKLTMRGLGSTKIYYKGHPEIKKSGFVKYYPLTSATEEELDQEAGEE